MVKKIIGLCLLLLPIYTLSAQHAIATKAGARGIATGNSNLVYQDIHSIFNNPAGLAHLQQLSAVGFIENRFLLTELSTVTLGVATPTTYGTFGLLIQHFGLEQYNDQKLGLSYSRLLLEDLAIGAQFDLLHTGISEYGNAFALTFELGLQYQIVPQLQAGFHLFNPIRATILQDEPLPAILQVGLTYTPSDYLVLSTAIEKGSTTPYSLKVGMEYFLLEKIYFRSGVQTNPTLLSMGIGYELPNFTINVAMTYHQVLGVSPSFGIQFRRE